MLIKPPSSLQIHFNIFCVLINQENVKKNYNGETLHYILWQTEIIMENKIKSTT